MKPSELVVGNKYEAKLMRASKKDGWDGFCPVIYIGTKDEGEDYQSFLFCETDKDAVGYSDVPWEFYIEDLGKRKKVRPVASVQLERLPRGNQTVFDGGMEPDELVVGNKYEVMTTKGRKHSWDGFSPVIYEGKKGEAFLFRETDWDRETRYPEEPWEFFDLEFVRPFPERYFVVGINRSRMVTEWIKIGTRAHDEESARRQALHDAQSFEPLQEKWREVESAGVEYEIEYADELLPEND